MADSNSTQTTPEHQAREVTATIGALHRAAWGLIDLRQILNDALEAEAMELGNLTPAGQRLLMATAARLLNQQTALLGHLQELLGVEVIDWEDVAVHPLDDEVRTASLENRHSAAGGELIARLAASGGE